MYPSLLLAGDLDKNPDDSSAIKPPSFDTTSLAPSSSLSNPPSKNQLQYPANDVPQSRCVTSTPRYPTSHEAGSRSCHRDWSVTAPATMAGASDIRVFVKWHERTVFAGEEVRCTITFRNVASAPSSIPHQRTARQSPAGLGISPGPAGVRTTSKLQPPPTPRGHRSTMSMTSPRAGAPLQAAVTGGEGRERRGHRKSVSIVSIGSGTVGEDVGDSHAGRLSRFNRGHGRASSLQITSFPPELGGTQSGTLSVFHPCIGQDDLRGTSTDVVSNSGPVASKHDLASF